MNGYVSLEMARRLKEAGVEIRSEKWWNSYNPDMLISLRDAGKEIPPPYLFNRQEQEATKWCYPAPSLAELWAWLTKNFYLENFYMQWDRTDQTTYVIGPAPDRPIWEVGDNLADALGELAIWMAERKMK